MSDQTLARLGVLLGFVYVGLAAIVAVLAWQNEGEFIFVIQTTLTGFTAFAVVGSLLVSRRPRNAIGWLFLSFGLASAAYGICIQVATYGLITAPGSISFAPVAGWLVFWFFEAMVTLLAFSILLFPSGTLPSRTWRPLAAGLGILGLLGSAIPAFASASMGPPETPIPNPFFVPALRPVWDAVAAIPVFALFVVIPVALAVSSFVARYRAAPVAEKQQLKWVLLAAFFTVVFMAAAAVPSPLRGIPNALSFVILPTAVAIAVLRYRLFDIDHLINRTLVYGVTSGLIGLLFFTGVVALQPILRPLTAGAELGVAATTLVAFALFRPIRNRVQDAVDRRFDRSRYDAARTLDVFSDELRDEVDLERVQGDLLRAVSTTMAPQNVSLWLRTNAPMKAVTISGRAEARKVLA